MKASDLPLVRSLKVGSLRVHCLETGIQWLDGGAMFGVVPRPLWEKKVLPDNRNRIPLALRCLLLEAPEGLVLVDTGAGNKEPDKFREIYGLDNGGNPTRLHDALRSLGFEPEDVAWVVNTHLHFDHAGGNTFLGPSGDPLPLFPRARYVVQEGELEMALSPNERTRASYFRDNLVPLLRHGRLETVKGEARLLEGVRLLPTPGHTPHHQSVLVESKGEAALFLGDLCPTSHHLPLPWIMAYDLEPLVTLETKRALWAEARRRDWILIFQHDPRVPWGRLDPEKDQLAQPPS